MITLVTGGQRSGKSNFAQEMALKLTPNPIYLATSRVWDKEHAARIARHKADRGSEWITIEEEKEIAKHSFVGKVVLVDCLTLWATNFFFDLDSDVDKTLKVLCLEFDKLRSLDAHFILVTNELGMGEMSQNELQRKFADLQGWLNQYVAKCADEVFLMISGIPVKIK